MVYLLNLPNRQFAVGVPAPLIVAHARPAITAHIVTAAVLAGYAAVVLPRPPIEQIIILRMMVQGAQNEHLIEIGELQIIESTQALL
jgi:hypothetical protein